jgi:hypothetical protein
MSETVTCGDVIRYRPGSTALMKVMKWDDLCGYRTYYGTHLYGEQIIVSGDKIQKASKEDLKAWEEALGERRAYTMGVEQEYA